jgi:hypothetical protein
MVIVEPSGLMTLMLSVLQLYLQSSISSSTGKLLLSGQDFDHNNRAEFKAIEESRACNDGIRTGNQINKCFQLFEIVF